MPPCTTDRLRSGSGDDGGCGSPSGHHMLVAKSVHPGISHVFRTYAKHQEMPIDRVRLSTRVRRSRSGGSGIEVERSGRGRDHSIAQFLRYVEDVKAAAALAHEHGALLVVMFTEAVSLGLVEPPRDADIVAGELQSLCHFAELWRPVCRHSRDQRKVHPADTRTSRGRDNRHARQSCFLSYALDARATHPARKSHIEHLYESGADCFDGDSLHDFYGKDRTSRTWRSRILSKAHYLG